MSRKNWLVVAALALTNVIVLGAMALAVSRSSTNRPAPPTLVPTIPPIPTISPQPTATYPPPWTPTPISTSTPQPTLTPSSAETPAETPSPEVTSSPASPPTPTSVLLENPNFERISANSIPGWQTGGFVNWTTGDTFDPATSYAAPRFHQADDLRQKISGPTLQIDTTPWIKLRAWVFQTVEVEPGSRVEFGVLAMGFVEDTTGGYILKVGVDPDGAEGCETAQWGTEQIVNQDDGVVVLASPEVIVGSAGRTTVCIFAETQFAQAYHAAFFDEALLTMLPPALP